MKYTKNETKIENTQEKEKFNLQECFTLWINESKKDKNIKYLSGFDFNQNRIVGFFNNEDEKKPKVKIYSVLEDGKKGDELIALWESKSKAGTTYLSGYTNENEKIIAFYGDMHKETAPYLKGYFR